MAVNYGGKISVKASEYIDAIQSTGTAVNNFQYKGIVQFFYAYNNSNWGQKLKRTFLPIWGNETANSIDIITLNNGEFAGGITHDPSYVESNGTGYFKFDSSISTLNIDKDSMLIGGLQLSNPTTTYPSVIGLGNADYSIRAEYSLYTQPPYTRSRARSGLNVTGGRLDLVDNNMLGFRITNVYDGLIWNITRRQSGISGSSISHTPADLPDIPLYAMARNRDGTATEIADVQAGMWFAGEGMSYDDIVDMTLAMKNLWETSNNSSIP